MDPGLRDALLCVGLCVRRARNSGLLGMVVRAAVARRDIHRSLLVRPESVGGSVLSRRACRRGQVTCS
jgi:hypothetical protein